MEGAVTWNVSQYMLVGLTLGLFAFVGFRRGVNRELLSMVGIGLGMLLATVLAPGLGPQVNRFYRLARFSLGGGLTADDPTAAWQKARELPNFVRTPADEQFLSVVVFAVIALLFYLWGQGRAATAHSLTSRVLGLLAGGINGFLVAYFLFPLIFPEPRAVITVPSGDISAALSSSQTIALAGVFFVVVLIAFGLHSASRSRRE